MAEHSAETTVSAPAHQIYQLWSHFNDFPKFMSHVKEVTYQDEQRSHWIVDVVGRHEWDAVNEDWIPDRRIGWRSTDGLENRGHVHFEPLDDNRTRLRVHIDYNPPAGWLGDIAEALGAGKRFERKLQDDLDHFAQMVAQAPPGALDPQSSTYLFHGDSAAMRGDTTPAQDATMDEEEEVFENDTERAKTNLY